MNVRSLMNRRKVIVDDIISVFLIIIVIYIIIFNKLFGIMSLAVYSFFCLLLYGLYRSYKCFFDRKLNIIIKVLNLIFGIACIILTSYTLYILFTRPNIPASFYIYFLGFPIFLIGLAGLLKGLIVDVFSPLFRFLNIIIGATTVLLTLIAIIFAEVGYLFHIFALLTNLTLNGVLRAALYLSEYGLSLNSFKNLKLVWFLMDSPSLPQQMENLHFLNKWRKP